MRLIRVILAEVLGLFLDDEFLAVAILCLVAVVVVLAWGLHATALVTGTVLLAGCLAILAVSTLRGMRR
jgi:hypothetical protein